ncbi:MAG: acetyl-CoA carboxylase biotin carboxyl carrier protein [Cellulosilyticaceae bacterium]
MSIEIIKTLIQEFNTSDLTKLKLNYDTFKIELEKEKEIVAIQQNQVPLEMCENQNTMYKAEKNVQTEISNEQAGKKIKSPMVGTFYNASSPDADAFVSVGKSVKKGDVICIIEAMKLMNEVEAEKDGEIIEILVENEQMVEFDQPLFVIK